MYEHDSSGEADWIQWMMDDGEWGRKVVRALCLGGLDIECYNLDGE